MLKSRLPMIALAIPEAVEQALQNGAEAIADSARNRVPQRTGALHDAIHVETEDGGVYVIAGDTGAFYGHIVEHGSSTVPPHPFMIPALEENKAEVIARVQAVLSKL